MSTWLALLGAWVLLSGAFVVLLAAIARKRRERDELLERAFRQLRERAADEQRAGYAQWRREHSDAVASEADGTRGLDGPPPPS